MNVNIQIQRRLTVALPPAQARGLIDDVERTIGRFPKLKKLTRLGPDRYLSELGAIGSSLAKIAHEVRYGAHYQRSADGSIFTWTALPDQGNASIDGSLSVLPHAGGCELCFKLSGELREIPVPLMFRLAAGPFIQGKLTHLVETFLERTRDALIASAKPNKKRAAR